MKKKKKQKPLTTDSHKFIDIEGSEMPKGLVVKLHERCWYMYEDTNTLREHLYSIEDLLEKIAEDKKYLSLTQKLMVNRIARLLTKNDCGYFRFVFNFTHSPFFNYTDKINA